MTPGKLYRLIHKNAMVIFDNDSPFKTSARPRLYPDEIFLLISMHPTAYNHKLRILVGETIGFLIFNLGCSIPLFFKEAAE